MSLYEIRSIFRNINTSNQLLCRKPVLESAKALLRFSKDKNWQQLVKEQVEESKAKPYCERLSTKEIEKSPMSYRDIYRVNRSRSVDLSFLSREKYLSRWSRENTPTDCLERYTRNVRRSYTPVREVSGIEWSICHGVYSGYSKRVEDSRHPLTSHRARTPLAMVTAPYHTNIHYRSEEQPFRKYDVFGLRTWSYPIYKYIYGRDHDYRRPYSFTRLYGTTPLYTPPQMTAECQPITTRRGYSGYSYLANETNYDIASQPRSLKNYMYTRTYLGTSPSPWYYSYYGNSGLRHFNSYRPNIYTPKTAIWTRYY